jgi:ribonuclease P protein component
MHASTDQMKTVDRLLRRSDFLRVQKTGRKWVSKTVVVQMAPNAPETGAGTAAKPRFGLTVTKKSCGKAVTRNRIRRRLRAAAYDILPANALPGHDYVLIGRIDTETAAYDRLAADLKWCLKRLQKPEGA